MSLLGKVLAILNVLTAIAFVALAALDWSKRHAWTYAVFRHDLVINGLPVEETDLEPGGDEPVVEQLNEKTLGDVFAQAGGQPVRTQRDEVKRLQGVVRGQIQQAGDENAQKQALYTTLLPLARTTGEREELSRRILDPQKPISDLMSEFDGLFQTTGDPQPDSLRALLAPRDERQAIAHLLFGLQPNPQALPRVQVVIGLREFNAEVNRQARALQTMNEEQRAALLQERGLFVQHYQAQVEQIRDRAELLADRRFFLSNQQKQRAEHEQLLQSRKQERADVEEQIERARARHDKLLAEQRTEERAVFEAQRQFRDAKQQNENLERQIRTLEKVGTEGKK